MPRFEPTGAPDIPRGKGTPGKAQLYIDRHLVGETVLPVTIPLIIGLEGLSCGRDEGSTVTNDYAAPFEFTGMLKHVAVEVSGELIEDKDAAMRSIMAHQ